MTLWMEPDRLPGQSCIVAGPCFAPFSANCKVKGEEFELICHGGIPFPANQAVAALAKKASNPPSATDCVRDDVLARVAFSCDLDIASDTDGLPHSHSVTTSAA